MEVKGEEGLQGEGIISSIKSHKTDAKVAFDFSHGNVKHLLLGAE